MDEKTKELAIAFRHELHAHPELPMEEKWTKARIISFLREHTRLEVVDRGRWCYAVYRAAPNARKIAFRADFDALPIDEKIDKPYCSTIPGVSHKCGHDGHTATLAAFAIEVDRWGSPDTIYFIFQHAEETGQGAKECAVLIGEEHIEEVFGYHNATNLAFGEVYTRGGLLENCASTGMSIFFVGTPAHASAPAYGRNPSMAIARMICALPQFHRPEDHGGLVLSTVINVDIGKVAFGTAAASGVLRITIRAEEEAEMDKLRAKIDALAYGLAVEYGLDYHIEYCDYFPETRNHAESVAKVHAACAKLGIRVNNLTHPSRGSEDFGYFTKATRGAYFLIGDGGTIPAHTSEYDFNDEIIPVAVSIFEELAGVVEK